MKKILSSTLAFALLLVGAAPALAADDVIFVVANSNEAKVKNEVGTTADTGFNAIVAGEDIEDDSTIDTGNATAESDVETEANSNDTSIEAGEVDDAAVGVLNTNEARVKNDVDGGAFSGANLIGAGDDVDGEAEIETGDADSTATVDTNINHNDTDVVLDDADDVLLGVGNFNAGKVKNDVEPVSDTGYNTILAGEDVEGEGATISTGDATSDADVETEANSNETDIETGNLDDLAGGVFNGNYVRVRNNVAPEAYSGANLIGAGDDVEGGSETTTGDAEATDTVVTRTNMNITRFNGM